MKRPSEVALEKAHFWFWVGPGAVITLVLARWLPWTAAMSWWALVYTARCAVLAARGAVASEAATPDGAGPE